MAFKLKAFIEKDKKIIAVRVEDEWGKLSDVYMTNMLNLSNLDCMQAEHLRGLSCYSKNYKLITPEELLSGESVPDITGQTLDFSQFSDTIHPKNYVPIDTSYFPRDEELTIYDWWYNYPDKALHVRGTRQSGKTYMINHFIDTFFDNNAKVYRIDLTNPRIREAYRRFDEHPYEPGKYFSRGYNTELEGFMKSMDSSFDMDTADLVFVDEIQAIPGIYNCIRTFAREKKCRLIVSGSYLNVIADQRSGEPRKYFTPTGGTWDIKLFSLSFTEFLRANGVVNVQVLYKDCRQYTPEEQILYEKVHALYKTYLEIGGYPEVVKSYIEGGSTNFEDIFDNIVERYIEDSEHYAAICDPMADLRDTMDSIAPAMLGVNPRLNKKRVVANIVNAVKLKKPGLTEREISFSLRWLRDSGLLGTLHQFEDDHFITTSTLPVKLYYMDLGMFNYFINKANIRIDTIKGYLAETFVYLELFHAVADRGIWGTSSIRTAEFKGVELDFICRHERRNTLVEVKYGDTRSRSFDKYCRNKMFDNAVKFTDKPSTFEGYSRPIMLAGFHIMATS